MSIANTPPPPYYAVIFTSVKKENAEGYASMAEKMVALAEKQPGFLGVESAREEIGITVSYWDSIYSIKLWKENTDHLVAQEMGKKEWYEHYTVRICLVQREYHL